MEIIKEIELIRMNMNIKITIIQNRMSIIRIEWEIIEPVTKDQENKGSILLKQDLMMMRYLIMIKFKITMFLSIWGTKIMEKKMVTNKWKSVRKILRV